MAEGRRKGAERRESEPDPAPRRSAKRRSSRLPRLVYWSLVLGLWLVIAAAGTMVWVTINLPPIQSLEIPRRPPQIEIVGLDGKPLATRGEMHGATVTLRELPPYLPRAFVAIEDRRFYSHFGIDPVGLLRAAAANVMRRGVAQGGSTITQQLAKNLFLTQERTYWRKLQEVVLALWLERKFSKTEILELYLNRVYFGAGAYGVDAAAQRYFGKSAKHVRVAEAAMLAGLVKSPSRLAPSRNPNGAEKRAQTVVAAMAEQGFIAESIAKTALLQPARAVKPVGTGTVNYVADWVMDVLDDLVGHVEEDIVIVTSIDPTLQAVAEKALVDELAQKGAKLDVQQGAIVTMTPEGAVRALVGGRNYAESQYNRAVAARRQPGSAFKPAVRLMQEVGAAAVAKTAYRLGIASKLETNPSLALGTSEVSLIELVAAYAPFANGGSAIVPSVVERVRTTAGKTLYVRTPQDYGRVVEARHVAMMNAMMRETLRIGTAQRAQVAGWPAAGKTGTSQDFRDAWFVGYTTHLITGVWIGNDDSSPTRKATGGGLPADIWSRVMKVAHQGVTVAALPGTGMSFAAPSMPPPASVAPPPAAFPPAANSAPIAESAPPAGVPVPPAPISGRAQPQQPPSNHGIDGWLVDRLFGRR